MVDEETAKQSEASANDKLMPVLAAVEKETAEVQNELEAMHETLTDESEELQRGTGLDFHHYKGDTKLVIIAATQTIRNNPGQRRGRTGRVRKAACDRNSNGTINAEGKWMYTHFDITHAKVQGEMSINELRETGYSEWLRGDRSGIENDAGRWASNSDGEKKARCEERVDAEHIRSKINGLGGRSAEPDCNEEPVCAYLGQSTETPEGIETYTPSPVWEHRAVGIAATWWSELIRGWKYSKVLEEYGWALGAIVGTVLIALLGWWVQRASQVPEGFVERGSPQWFRSRLHHGRRE
ncbi:hypothetical protein BJ322DRAFT_1112313 [Thelephora terrestris]|uniref:Uncharacterized protein n=1 Tax=Thelephora terrestris TaxID=56493 RepID=A0A9P6H7K0_9AGAM|nr:hypothetical protein BJ322DRAFT_1112313 [Thelephora terrestris]